MPRAVNLHDTEDPEAVRTTQLPTAPSCVYAAHSQSTHIFDKDSHGTRIQGLLGTL